ncbi:MAG: DNA phosphorothioation-associated putative methyltransferase [Planctomycetes bacterium]|nr:DNA phosphorothioation-associated putative methyltransferase [Planctomycetota bacterium]
MNRQAIDRSRTAIGRVELSRPVRLALDSGVLQPGMSVLDYGCGRGDDVRLLKDLGYASQGWDPAHATTTTPEASDLVNLGFVVNVIEDPGERVLALRAAWGLARRALVVGAQVVGDERGIDLRPFGDGFVTRAGTFQKYYRQTELREWLDAVLSVPSVAAAPGIFVVFREEEDRQRFLASRHRRRAELRPRICDLLVDQHRAILEPLLAFFEDRGRLPESDEIPTSADLAAAFGSLRQAFAVVRRATGVERWERITVERSEDFLIYLGLQQFGRAPRLSDLPLDLRRDARALFGTFKSASEQAVELLKTAGDQDLIDSACRASQIGKQTPKALYIHRTALERLPTLLRVYEGCARGLIGEVESANIIKLNRWRPQVSYLCYPDFDREAHPPLARSIIVTLDKIDVSDRVYDSSINPPILHRKEDFVADDYPGREKFARLTRQEEKRGLYSDTDAIGTRLGWEKALANARVTIRGHRLFPG